MTYTESKAIADSIIAEMRPYCERVEIAGSIRRKKQDGIKDLEIVAIPRWEIIRVGFFDEDTKPINCLHRNWALRHPGVLWIKPGKKSDEPGEIQSDGKYWRGLINGKCKLDLFLTTPEQWGLIFMIRTGPAAFSRRMVTSKREDGLLQDDLRVADGWMMEGESKLQTREEIDVFKLSGIEWIEPELRK